MRARAHKAASELLYLAAKLMENRDLVTSTQELARGP